MNDVIYRRARTTDVSAMADLINGFAAKRVMLPKSADSIGMALDDFIVATDRHGRLLGCGAVREYSPSLAEVGSVAVVADAHGLGLGRGLVSRVEQLAASRGITEVFALTTTPQFFGSLGYATVDRALYPEKVQRDCTACPLRHACVEICVRKSLAEVGAARIAA
jgi:amino-acid N-acetyltransferase